MLLDIIQDKSNLQVSYWDKDGKTHIEVIPISSEDQFVWLTNPKDKTDLKVKCVKNWNGKTVYKHRVDLQREKLNRYRQYEILDAQPDELKEKIFSYNLPDIFFVDIENKTQEGKPNPENPDKPITVIGVCCPNDTVMVLSGGYNLTQKEQESIQKRIDEHFAQVNRHFNFVFRYFETEYDLLYFFLSVFVPKMALISGWNVEDYDWRYMYNRAKLLGIDPSLASPSRILTGPVDRPAHVGLIDYLKAYKKWTWNSNENYRLDTIGEKLCKIKKVQHVESLDDMLHNNFEKYVYYNAIDCCLVKLIHEACNALTCGLTTAWLGRIKAMDCFSTTYIPENLLRASFSSERKVLGIDPYAKKKEGEKYEGAFVKQPIPGLHKYCTCNDYASLYPSLMRQFNIGPETLVTLLPEADEALKQQWRDKGYIVCASGAVFQKEDGHLKKIITDLYFKRKAYKKTSFKFTQIYYDLKDLKHANASPEEIEDYLNKNDFAGRKASEVDEIMSYCQVQADIYNNFQLGTKVVINGIYGAFGFSGFYFYNPTIAEAVTKQGKNAILNAERLINLWATKIWQKDEKTHQMMGIKIIDQKPIEKGITVYIDTDSCASDTFLNISDEVISIETESGTKVYHKDDCVKVMRNGVEVEILASEIKESDLLWQETIKGINKTNKITIEQLYNLGTQDMGSTLAGHESVNCDYDVLNIKQNDLSYSGNGVDFTSYYAPVKRVIRHKVTKAKWSLVDSDNNEVIVTNDHSLMVLRDGNLQKIKPYDVDVENDFLVTISDGNIEIRDIVRCEQIGDFEDEYVYDIEMDDETHTFVANNILVHNSIYTSYDSIIHTTDWFQHDVWRLTKINKQNDQKEFEYVSKGGYPTEEDARKYFDVDSIDESKYVWSIDTIDPEGREFCLTINRVFMSSYLKRIHEEYAKKNGTPNILDFELEAYSEAGIWLAKKKYIKNMTWAEPNVYYDSCAKIKATGVEIAQTSSSQWVKKQLIDLVKWIFQQEEFVLENFIDKKLAPLKKEFMLQSPETISVNKAMNKYSEYVLSDSGEIELAPKTMITCAGAALYNYILNSNEKFKKRYSTLFDADKLCVLYVKPTERYKYWKREMQIPVSEYVKNPDMYKLISDAKETRKGNIDVYTDIMSLQKCEAFSYPAGMFPMDMASNLEIDKNKMFDLLILSPVNRIVEAMGFQPVDISMTYAKGLW